MSCIAVSSPNKGTDLRLYRKYGHGVGGGPGTQGTFSCYKVGAENLNRLVMFCQMEIKTEAATSCDSKL